MKISIDRSTLGRLGFKNLSAFQLAQICWIKRIRKKRLKMREIGTNPRADNKPRRRWRPSGGLITTELLRQCNQPPGQKPVSDSHSRILVANDDNGLLAYISEKERERGHITDVGQCLVWLATLSLRRHLWFCENIPLVALSSTLTSPETTKVPLSWHVHFPI